MAHEPTWYSVVIDHKLADGWHRWREPWTQVWDCSADEVADQVVQDLPDMDAPWAVGVFEGVRFDRLLAERWSG